MLTNRDIAELVAWRRQMHRHPEISGQEAETALAVVAALEPLRPSEILTGLGGHGVAAVFDSAEPGPTVLFRAELDALPIEELSDAAHRSQVPGQGHLCGHDGHMGFLLALGRLLARRGPARGRVVLLFQPAEEDGSGAAAVIADARYAMIRPDWAFAIHNLPGLALGHVAVRAGVVNCASQGLRVVLTGKTAHASLPETGLSPAFALAELIPALTALGDARTLDDAFRLVTVTHARLGAPAFGIAPGEAELWVTLRTTRDAPMAALHEAALALITKTATQQGLIVQTNLHDAFAASVNDAEAVVHLTRVLEKLALPWDDDGLPMRASEDFGRFGQGGTRAAMLLLGAGENHPALHNPDYDFPDDLIPIGAAIFHSLVRDLLG